MAGGFGDWAGFGLAVRSTPVSWCLKCPTRKPDYIHCLWKLCGAQPASLFYESL